MAKIKINYGLMVFDPEIPEENGEKEIVHFCGFEENPSQNEIEHLREELRTDEEFGLTEVWERLVIIPAPYDIVEQYRKMINND